MEIQEKTPVQELAIPPAAVNFPQSYEIMRAWITDNGLDISFIRNWEQPGFWGIFLVDLANHPARAYAAEGICSEEDAIDAIVSQFMSEWENTTDIGVTEEFKKQ